ncbi:hypothetical protein E3T43_07505 [Cryobacterium sp. Hh7]|uniref:hypothetical protein n=1 Tax=Cryobacterium sp. Hh7 TaxID=1259159 RepID=UPI00106A67A6|nr:hypothetical protein [Cryobacterium sp. Hh7]TFD58084.1 hypothetical protein E3T43_07505 [Cryobacterium sp. Hh7]
MTAVEDLSVAIRTLTDLTDARARGAIAELRDAAELKAALRRTVPGLLAILTAGEFWVHDNLGIHAVQLARLINAQPDPHDEQPC